MIRLAAALLLLTAMTAGAADVDHEDWDAIGWNGECGVAFSVLGYPKHGTAGKPYAARAGTMVLAKGKVQWSWKLNAEGLTSWDPAKFAAVQKELKAAGFSKPGYPEVIRDGPLVNKPELVETLASTTTLSADEGAAWLGPEWRWAGANYNPDGSCVLLAFEQRSAPRRYQFLLVRAKNRVARLDRALAHATNARLLYDGGYTDDGIAEAADAARQAPDLAAARYGRAAILSLSGQADAAVDELTAAVKLDRKLRAKARVDLDFEGLRDRDDFKDIVR